MLGITNGVLSTLTIHPERMTASLSSDMLATDLVRVGWRAGGAAFVSPPADAGAAVLEQADYLVRKGVPFRETHHVAGEAVRLAEDRGVALSTLTAADLKPLHDAFEDDVVGVWDFTASVESRSAPGGTSASSVHQQIEDLEAWLRR